MKAVDADKLSEKAIVVQNSIHPELGFFIIPIDVAKTLKIVDAVEVVRCCDCVYYHPQNQSLHWNHAKRYCMRKAAVKVTPNDYCSFGERKENT